MKVLHLLAAGGTGGIEVLCKNLILQSNSKNIENYCGFLFAEGETYNYLKSQNVKMFSVKELDFTKKINFILDYCKEEKIDIIVMHHGGLNCNRIYIELKKRNNKLKYIRYMHACFDKYSFGNSKNLLKNILIKLNMKKTIKCSDKIIYISNASKKSFRKRFKIESYKEKIIYNGISPEFFQKLKEKNFNGKLTMIFVGRLAKVKGVNLLIDAFSNINNMEKIKELIIVGNGVEFKSLKKKVIDLKLEEKIKFVGRQENVIEWLDKSDIFIYPSIWEEGFGISVVEAMSRGCIPITFSKGALPEIINNNANGFLVNKVSSKCLAEKIDYICDLDNKINISKLAIKKSKEFTIENTIHELEEVYKEVIKNI